MPALPAFNANERLDGALVLSGGGARGAYQAGVIAALVEAHGIKDGEPFPGVNMVCGASIGTFNGWMVATAQYSQLTNLWQTIGGVPLFEVKRQFAAINNSNSGLLTRLVQALKLGHGLVTNVRGVLDATPVQNWIDSQVNPATPLVIPLIFSVTNLTQGAGQLFYRPATNPLATSADRLVVAERVQGITAGMSAREATNDILHDALRASANIPMMWDPVTIDGPDGPQDYVDGGIANNSPVDVARAIAKNVYVIFLDPNRPPPQEVPNAFAIGLASLGVAQHRVIDVALRSAYVETLLKRALMASGTASAEILNNIFDANLYVMHPHTELPVKVPEFHNQAAINETFQIGYQQAKDGWKLFDPNSD
jgi:predicted acylesterase/phospholipase RssA